MKKIISVIAIIIFVLNVGCGNYNSTPPKGPLPNAISIVRNSGSSLLQPLTKTSLDQPLIQAFYKHMWMLHPFSKNTAYSCGADDGLTYDLTFIYNSSVVWKAIAVASGCIGVDLNATDSRQVDDTFWNDLAQLIGEPVFPPTPPAK